MNLPIRITCLLIVFTAVWGCKKDTTEIRKPSTQKLTNEVIPKPVITAAAPMQGMIYSAVKITGTNFSPSLDGNIVRFNSWPAVVNSASATELTVTVPGNATTGNITVLSNDFIGTSQAPFRVLKFAPDGQQNINLDGVTETAISKTGIIYALKKTAQKFTQLIKYTGGASAIIFNNAPEFEDENNYFDHDYKGLLIDKTGNVYFASNYMRHRAVGGVVTHTVLQSQIVKINPAGDASLVAGGEAGAAEGNGRDARFRNIKAMTMDAAGNIYVSDLGNSRLRKVTPSGNVTTLSSSVKIKKLTISSAGDLYFHDNSRIYKVTAATRRVTGIAGPYPNGLDAMIFDAADNLLVSERSGIWVINKANYVSRVGLPGSVNSIALDAAGKLYTFAARGVTRYALK